VLDVHSRRVVGWWIDATPTAALAINALSVAIANHNPPTQHRTGLRHRDPLRPRRAAQFTSWAFTRRAQDSGLVPSIGSIGDCYARPRDLQRGGGRAHQAAGQVDEDRHPKTDITLGRAIEQWLDVADLEDATRDRYEGLVRIYIAPTPGSLPAARLGAELLERFCARLQRCRRLGSSRPSADHTCQPLSSSTVVHSEALASRQFAGLRPQDYLGGLTGHVARIPRTAWLPRSPRRTPPTPAAPSKPGETQPDRLTAPAHCPHHPRRHSGRRAAQHPKLSPTRSFGQA
jgi:hypothetical protein